MTDPDVRALAKRLHNIEERIATLGRSRQLTASSIPVVVDGEDGPETVEMPLTTGVSQGVRAGAAAEEALAEARQAIEDAANALVTSNGKNSRRRGQTEPEPPEGGWVQGDQWVVDNTEGVPVEVRVWDGSAFVPEQILAAELLVLSSGGVVRLADGVVTADAIAADAIDGMVITGARVRTAATGQRLELDINGLVAYAPTGESVARLFSGSGGLEISGTLASVSGSNIQTKDPVSSRTAWMSPSALAVQQIEGRSSSVGADGLSAFLRSDRAGDGKDRRAGVSPYEASVSRYIDNGPSSPRTQVEMLTAGPDRISLSRAPSTSYPINGVEASQFWVRPVSSSNFGSGFELGVEKITSPRGTVEFTSMVKFQGDTDWAEIPLLSGFVVQNSQPLQWRMKQGTLQFRGRIGRADSSPIGGSYVTVTGPSSALGGLVSGAGWSNRPILTPGSDTNKPGLLLIQADGSLRAAIDGIAFFPVAQVLL